jgi:hypothetical protein
LHRSIVVVDQQNNNAGREIMTRTSTIRSVETLACDAGWRNYHFVKLMTEDGLVGWSEFDEGFGAPGVTTAIERLATRSARTRCSTSGFTPNCFARHGRQPAAWWRWRSGRSRTRCSM